MPGGQVLCTACPLAKVKLAELHQLESRKKPQQKSVERKSPAPYSHKRQLPAAGIDAAAAHHQSASVQWSAP